MVKVCLQFLYCYLFIFVLHLETGSKSEAPPKNTSLSSNEKRSRRKPAFSHQVCFFFLKFNIFLFYDFIALKIITQAPRQSLPIFKQSNVDPGSIHFWNSVVSTDKNDRRLTEVSVFVFFGIYFCKIILFSLM